MRWPASLAELGVIQDGLADLSPEPWLPETPAVAVGGVFVCFGRGGTGPGAEGEAGWSAAAVCHNGRIVGRAEASGPAGGPYRSGCLAMREGRLLEEAINNLAELPTVMLVNATGRDHPRRAGLALHLGAVLNVPTIGITHRPLVARGDWPATKAGSTAPLHIGDEVVGFWLRTQGDTRPLAIHAAWRTTPEAACEIVLGATSGYRTPQPLREARRLARTARHHQVS